MGGCGLRLEDETEVGELLEDTARLELRETDIQREEGLARLRQLIDGESE